MQISEVITSYDEKRYLNQFGDVDMLHNMSIPVLLPYAPQYEHTSFVTMVTYWAPDFPNIKGFAGHL